MYGAARARTERKRFPEIEKMSLQFFDHDKFFAPVPPVAENFISQNFVILYFFKNLIFQALVSQNSEFCSQSLNFNIFHLKFKSFIQELSNKGLGPSKEARSIKSHICLLPTSESETIEAVTLFSTILRYKSRLKRTVRFVCFNNDMSFYSVNFRMVQACLFSHLDDTIVIG